MVWFQVCDTFWSHPKVMQLPASAVGLWVRSGSYSAQHLTDGFLADGMVPILGGTEDDATTLVFAGLWKRVRGGYRFHDWDVYQQSRESVLARRAVDSERKRKYRTGKTKNSAKSPASRPAGTPNGTPTGTPNGTPTGTPLGRDKSKPNLTKPKEHMLTAVAASDFEKFWDVYPRRVGKQAALKAFTKEAKTTDPADIIAGAQRLADDPNLPDKTFIPHPATWLTRAGWLDEPYPQRETKPADKPTPQPPTFDRAAAINPEAVPPPANLHDILKGNTS